MWAALGDVDNYVEPFAGSLAVLLERPAWHRGTVETVNDRDAYLANVWRAIAAAPDEVARWCDWPVNETDLIARHLWLVNDGRRRIAALESDPDFYDAKVAGWWLWGINAWIGSGWCSGRGPHTLETVAGGEDDRKLPHLGDPGRGPHSGTDMTGGGSGQQENVWDQSLRRDGEPPVYGYMRALAQRLRRVRVCCGDWSRVVTHGALAHGATVGVLLDPPYDDENTTAGLYSSEESGLSSAVREWAIERGEDSCLSLPDSSPYTPRARSIDGSPAIPIGPDPSRGSGTGQPGAVG